MKKTEKQFARELIAQLEGESVASVRKVVDQLVKLFASRRELHRVKGVIQAIEVVWRERYGASTVTVATAFPLSETLRKKISALAPGAELRERVEESLIGGARLRVDDEAIDGTIDGHLKRLQTVFGNS